MKTYPVVEVFKSLQGEGHFAGYPMAFIRLAGCSVKNCSIREECDEAPWKSTEVVPALELAQRAWQLAPGGIALITGGEPTDHDLLPLIGALSSYRMRVHIETSGENPIVGYPLEWITVSPKTPNYVQRTGHTLKIVMRPEMTWMDVLKLDEGTQFFHRYLQPLDMPDGTSNLQQVIALLLARDNVGARWALSTQAHKVWKIK